MRFQARILFIALVVLIGCDKPLTLQPEDNISALTLQKATDDTKALFSWTKVKHPAFGGYWFVRLPLGLDSIQNSEDIAPEHIMFSTPDADSTQFLIPQTFNIQGEGTYQVFAEIGGRLLSSNQIQSEASYGELPIFPHNSYLGNPLIGGKGCFYVIGHFEGLEKIAVFRHDIATKTLKRSSVVIELEPNAALATRLEYGDFGNGNELAFYDGNTSIYFLDEVSLEVKHTHRLTTLTGDICHMPVINRLAIPASFPTSVQVFSRATNTWQDTFYNSNWRWGFYGDLVSLPGKTEIWYWTNYDVNIVKYDEAGRAGYGVSIDPSEISGIGGIGSTRYTRIVIDPQSRYYILSSLGHIFSTEYAPVRQTYKLKNITMKDYGFSHNGNTLFALSAQDSMILYNCDDFSLRTKAKVTEIQRSLGVVHTTEQAYFTYLTHDGQRSRIRYLAIPD
ncbi:MAG: hypothetical protein AB8F95_19830 [Bacteroidia bacterium]